MKYLKLFNESLSFKINEILSKPNWTEVVPTKNKKWERQLEYQLTDDIKIWVVKRQLLPDNLSYLMVFNNKEYPIGLYGRLYGSYYNKLFNHHNLSDYEKMMLTCKYLIPFFIKEPNEDMKHDISDCFISIKDDFNLSLEVKWGYSDNKNFGFFPAHTHDDYLCLSLIYEYISDLKYKDISHLIKDGIDRLYDMYNINPDDVIVIMIDQLLTINIKF
jgi:hypothetical protein